MRKRMSNTIIDNNDGTSTVLLPSKVLGLQHVQINTADVPLISSHRWSAAKVKGNIIYALTSIKKPDGTRTTRYMHGMICDTPPGMVVDHIDHNGLNNCRSNLRVVPQYVNIHNQSRPARGWVRVASGKYRACIQIKMQYIHLGMHDTAEEARAAYLDARKRYGVAI